LDECPGLLLEGALVSVCNIHTVVGDVTWNWALMLGGFFFLCRWSRDLVVRSCSVRLTMNFRDRESSKLCTAVTQGIDSLLVHNQYNCNATMMN